MFPLKYFNIIFIYININNVRILTMIYHLKIDTQSLLTKLHKNQIPQKHTSRLLLLQ